MSSDIENIVPNVELTAVTDNPIMPCPFCGRGCAVDIVEYQGKLYEAVGHSQPLCSGFKTHSNDEFKAALNRKRN